LEEVTKARQDAEEDGWVEKTVKSIRPGWGLSPRQFPSWWWVVVVVGGDEASGE
jgi:hypothetical protein